MVKNIFFVDRFPITKEFYIRNEFEFLINKGYTVKFLDISRFLKRQHIQSSFPSELEKYVIRFSSKKEFHKYIKERAIDSIVVSTVPFISSSAWMYYRIFRSSIPYVLEENTSFPSFDGGSKLANTKHNYSKFIKKTNLDKVLSKPKEVFNYYISLFFLKRADMIVTSKVNNKSIFKKLEGKKTIKKYSLSPDYKLAKKVDNTINIQEPYAVFVDQYFVHHPDFKTNQIIHSFTKDEYYDEINTFLTKFKQISGLKIVIASHPRRLYDHGDDFNDEFTLYFNKTAELIKYSRIALFHFSTAISFSVIFNKPFLLLNSNLFSDSNISPKIEGFAHFFNKTSVNITEDIEFLNTNKQDIFKIQEETYEQYLNQFLKHPKAIDMTLGEKILFMIDKLRSK